MTHDGTNSGDQETVHQQFIRAAISETGVICILAVSYGIGWMGAADYLHLHELSERLMMRLHEGTILLYTLNAFRRHLVHVYRDISK